MVPRLAPLIQQEIIIRLLSGPHGPQLRHLAAVGSPSQQIAKAVAWLKQNFTQALQGDELAARAHMSPSTFREHFRAITGTSPLQYQKQLRLQEARQLMLSQNIDAVSASGLVGYESASQFSREYSRLFGKTAPARCPAYAAGLTSSLSYRGTLLAATREWTMTQQHQAACMEAGGASRSSAAGAGSGGHANGQRSEAP